VLLSVRNVTKRFPVRRGLLGGPLDFVTAVGGVTFEADRGEILGMVGESGCGKSTLGRCVVGLEKPDEGLIEWNGEDACGVPSRDRRRLRRKFQMVFQNPYASLDPRQRIGPALQEALAVGGLKQRGEQEDFSRKLAEDVGLAAADLDKYPHEFSGGQRQRIGLIRALACDPDMIVLDEPVSSLDVSVQSSILNLLAKWNREKNLAYLFISHDLEVVGYLSGRLLVMYLGRVVESGPTESLFQKPRHPYTRGLLAAGRDGAGGVRGEPPNPAQIPSGCPFHPRCAFAEDRCRAESQVLDGEKDWKTACWKWDRL
jgi:peptide/nickel transport system ATP-binding protein